MCGPSSAEGSVCAGALGLFGVSVAVSCFACVFFWDRSAVWNAGPALGLHLGFIQEVFYSARSPRMRVSALGEFLVAR